MRKRCIRRHYALVDPVALAIAGAFKVSESDLDRLRMRELSSIDSFATDAATTDDFRTVCDLLNLAETMALAGIGGEVLDACKAAQDALISAKSQHEVTGRFGLTGGEIDALRDLYAWHDAQRSTVDRSTYERAIKRTVNRIRSSHPSVRELV